MTDIDPAIMLAIAAVAFVALVLCVVLGLNDRSRW